MRHRLSRAVRPAWPLGLIIAAAFLGYAPALRTPFWLDDYFYLVAARELSTPDYLRAAFTPWGNEPLLPFTRDFWRPLAFSWFELLQPLFDGHALPYHLFLLAGHVAAVILTWAVAARIDPRPAVRIAAAGIVALYPGAYQSVTWISSVNSLALPLALAAWLALLHATGAHHIRWRLLTLATLLLALAAMHRETAWVALPVIAGWHVAITSRWRIRRRDTWLPLLPFAALALAYVVIRTRGFTEPLANRDVFGWGDHVWRNYRTLLELLLLPFNERIDGMTGWRSALQQLSAPVVPLLVLGCILRRRWGPAILLAGVLISLLAIAPNRLGIGPRYLYFTVPCLALGLALLAADLIDRLPARWRTTVPAVAGAVLLLGTTWSLNQRVAEWADWGPGQQQAWLDALRAEYPTLPPGTTIYAAGNVPGWLTAFDGVNLGPAVRWQYPGAAGAVYVPPGQVPELGPGDVLFVAP
jgi:hypothetical protein